MLDIQALRTDLASVAARLATRGFVLAEIATAQLLSYLKATGLKRGLLLNFGEKQMVSGVKRISLMKLLAIRLNEQTTLVKSLVM